VPDSIWAQISNLRAESSIGDAPGYSAPLIPDLTIRVSRSYLWWLSSNHSRAPRWSASALG
jgi:hypothetical protein